MSNWKHPYFVWWIVEESLKPKGCFRIKAENGETIIAGAWGNCLTEKELIALGFKKEDD